MLKKIEYLLKLPIHFVIALFIGILSYFFKKEKTILFGSMWGTSFLGNNKYLYLKSLIHLKNYKSYWITNNKTIYNDLKSKNLPVLYKNNINTLFLILKSKYLFIDIGNTDIFIPKFNFGNFNIIQSWHGTSIKKIFLNDFNNKFYKLELYLESRRYHSILATSQSNKELMIDSFKNDNVIITGLPRNDVFFDKSLIFSNFEKKYNFKIFLKIFLYAPTFRENQNIKPYTDNFLKELNIILNQKGYLFLIKLHVFDKSIQIKNNFSNIKIVNNKVDIQEILYYTDTLITDYSSTFIDFMITNKPIIFYPYDYKNYLANCRNLDINYFKDLPGPFAYNENQLLNLIDTIDVWFNNSNYKKKYNDFNDLYNYYKDGNSCKRVFEYLQIN